MMPSQDDGRVPVLDLDELLLDSFGKDSTVFIDSRISQGMTLDKIYHKPDSMVTSKQSKERKDTVSKPKRSKR